MTSIVYLSPREDIPANHHVSVVIHKDERGVEKGYFYDSKEKDFGGSGPFDWLMKEVLDRATRYATERGISTVVVRAKRD